MLVYAVIKLLIVLCLAVYYLHFILHEGLPVLECDTVEEFFHRFLEMFDS